MFVSSLAVLNSFWKGDRENNDMNTNYSVHVACIRHVDRRG